MMEDCHSSDQSSIFNPRSSTRLFLHGARQLIRPKLNANNKQILFRFTKAWITDL
jgi:hypothetical protein